MKTLIKTAVLSALMGLSALTLTGCSSGLDPNTFEVTLNSEYSPGITSDRTYTILQIRSLVSEPISVNNVQVNDGRCVYSNRYGDEIKLPVHFQIGQVFTLYLKCPYDAVVKVDVETEQGAASYSFK